MIPLYNKAEYVAAAVESVLNQTSPPFEVVVVDDGSTDDGARRVASFVGRGVRLISQPNAGVSVARNTGVAHCTGDYVAFLDADDLYSPSHLARLCALARQFPEAPFVCTGYWRVAQDGRRSDVLIEGVAHGAAILVNDFYGQWSRASFTHTCAIAARRSLLQAHGIQFPVGERLGEDQDVWFRLSELGPIAYLNEPSIEYRVGLTGSATSEALVVDPLPCYVRLARRLLAGRVPPHMVEGARRLVASHWLNVARARAVNRQLGGAWALLATRWATGSPLYFLRTAVWLLIQQLRCAFT